MQDKALQSGKMQDNPAKSRTVGNSGRPQESALGHSQKIVPG